ncbi:MULTISPECIES: cytochrome c peroxidase [unclassified Burkholderia]|uniref:cytochrome-c peroxidase n=1 Tax=unclassified Burkholderia TaxID=2613784 RepID=UPI000758C15B|nr:MULTISPECIES: cytochrome c peroxidase [unclassified Burkholderia]KVN07959.1 cytochrome-c methylamine utilization protein [Burkholderia sp. MSMB1552]KWZ50744.1 cytochrome-c methylamine utilization protein [Burkholderia sp. MSMB1588]
MTDSKRRIAARRAEAAAFAARACAIAFAPGQAAFGTMRKRRPIPTIAIIATIARAASGVLAACASAIAFASGPAAPGATAPARAKPAQDAVRAGTASPPPPTTILLPGAPPQRVVGTIGRGTPQVASKVDPTAAAFRPDPALVALGKRVFFDPALSEPRGTSCASCHDPGRAFAPTLSHAALAGPRVPQGSRPGHFSRRNAPSLLYVRYVPRRHFYQDDDALAPAPFGGLFSDGRADTLAEQLRGPLFDPDEMNNASPAALMRKIGGTALGAALAERFGASVRRDPERMARALGDAMQAYLQSDEMAPFSSRYDAYVTKRAPLTPQELRGLALFRNPDKGNCMSCHTLSDTASRPERSLFTDFGYDAIAVPRNRALPANRDPRHFDNGLCDTAAKLRWPEPTQWCGYLRTPGLRNVAVKESFMHNGVFDTLRDAVAFYNTRSTDPTRWYHGRDTFDDVPRAHRGNINVNSTPMNRRPGTPPAMTDADIDDLVAFLRTLTDARYVGLMPAAPDGKAARP